MLLTSIGARMYYPDLRVIHDHYLHMLFGRTAASVVAFHIHTKD